ncbi:biotin carboxyl carrier protein [Roseivirga pacifica]|uniref:Biotin carboxyl carrier protein n=1 Tax=Roseivirga pacifica TaxID=1267423 RepID=A0A1I0NXU6_9BACT|nr:acetyl-CoA carboxylase biotin carboxyl carrier protein subunit [Roseivirga pacifica]RKQ51544.1 biotin carboxyl carrier protein [Roseivirga pacifica]SEW06587.1 biotin carboxyl carrier protein [Roseivirga pacifica]
MYTSKTKDGKEATLEFSNNQLLFNGQSLDFQISKNQYGHYQFTKDGTTVKAEILEVDEAKKKFIIQVGRGRYPISLKDDTDLLLEKLGMSHLQEQTLKDIKAPMPGLILDILVEPGQEINKGDQVMILEAMKMENVLKSPGSGTISSIEVEKGQSVEKNSILIKF